MADNIETFFSAWGAPDATRDGMVTGAVCADVQYSDPRGAVEGVAALCSYVSQFAASAPGAAAEVVENTVAEGQHAVRVRFYGEGWEQFGRYKVRLDNAGRVAQITGVAEAKA